jgi:hypothetical protein
MSFESQNVLMLARKHRFYGKEHLILDIGNRLLSSITRTNTAT